MKSMLFALLFAVSSVAYGADHKFGDITHKELTEAIKAKTVVLIDVNGSDSFKSGHIPGALDFETKGKELAATLPKDKAALVVAYCGSPQCPAWEEGAKAVAALGYTNVKHYTGGISGWKEAGGEIQK